MRRLEDIPRAWGNAEPDDLDWDKDRLISDLEAAGHKPISIDRAVATVEQCERGDDFPPGWCNEPLMITVYPDPDAGFPEKPERVYLHAGRSGLMEVFLRSQVREKVRIFRLRPLDAANAETLDGFAPLARVEVLLDLCRDDLTGHFEQSEDGESATFCHDEELERLGRSAQSAIRAYRDRLRSMPNLFADRDDSEDGGS